MWRRRLLHYGVSSAEDEEEDRISNLPDSIVHHIYSFLPFEKVAETCLLSKRWKHLWYSYPCLDFNYVFSKYTNRIRPTVCIDHIVRLLEKHSDVKELRFRGPVMLPSDLNRLMKVAVRHNVQTLDVKFETKESFTLPRSVVNCLSLRDLRLESRFFELPPSEVVVKNGFKSLGSLSLSRVNFGGDEPSSLLNSSFPSLTNLRLDSCLGLRFLRIQKPGLREISLEGCKELQELDVLSAEKLEKLSVVGCFTLDSSTRVRIDAPLLERVVWSRNVVVKECNVGTFGSLKEAVVGIRVDRGDRKMRSVSKFLTAISRCQCLTVEQELIKIISGFTLRAFERLKSLKVKTCLGASEAQGLVSLLRSSPLVDTIFISIEKGHYGWHERKNNFWESQAQSLDSFLGRLRYVKVCGFGDETKDSGFVKFLLENVRDLQRFSVSKVGRSIMADIVKSQLIFE